MHYATPQKQEKDNATRYKTRLGVWMFLSYGLVYAGFVAINAIRPKLLGTPLWGQNLAVVYGMGLILVAFVLALIYNRLCSKAEARLNTPASKEAAK